MKIKVKLSRTNEIKEIQIEKGSTINDILKKINLLYFLCLPRRDDSIVGSVHVLGLLWFEENFGGKKE